MKEVLRQKMVLKLDLHDSEGKRKAMKAVSTFTGIDSISMDMKDKKMTVVGMVDPVNLVLKLRKIWPTEIISVGPAKQPEKAKEETKKDEKKKEETKNNGAKQEEGTKSDQEKKKEADEQVVEPLKASKAYNQQAHYYYQYSHSIEENPNACVIS